VIPKRFNTLTAAYLQSLVNDKVHEGKSIEYKEELPGHSDRDKARFLAAVSSFANTAGGDLLLGVAEEGGLPKSLPSVEIPNLDEQKLRIDQILLNGLEPRLPRVDIHAVKVAEARYVLVLRVPKSWLSPHRVRPNNKFYGRGAAGKFEMDVSQLRTAFTLSETVAARIRNFRDDRIWKVHARETPILLQDGGRMILHLLPLTAFTEHAVINIENYNSCNEKKLHPIHCENWNSRINLDGVVTFSVDSGGANKAYTQLFRTGAVEAVETLAFEEGNVPHLSQGHEADLKDWLDGSLPRLAALGIEPPIYVFLSFAGVRDCRFHWLDTRLGPGKAGPLHEDMLVMPEVVIEQYGAETASLLRPVFDIVWNAFGLPRSLNYDDKGNWISHL
jgi:hypothetical protein